MVNTETTPIALTIAGSDSGGGAGIQADLKTFHQFGVFGTSAITAITAQNTIGVHAIHTIPLADVRAQIDAVVEDLRPSALKTGMLATAELTDEVAACITRHGLTRYVMDPVMVATSGDRLLAGDAEVALRGVLIPLATLVTPNLEEAALLTNRPVETPTDMAAAARALVDLGAGAALVKGGHLEDEVIDILWDGENEYRWQRARIATKHTHGTGCTLSAAIAAGLAQGRPLVEAVSAGVDYVANAIGTAPGIGSGQGPVNHWAPVD